MHDLDVIEHRRLQSDRLVHLQRRARVFPQRADLLPLLCAEIWLTHKKGGMHKMRGIAACVACFWWSDNPDYLEFTYHNSCTDAIMSGEDPFKILDRIKTSCEGNPRSLGWRTRPG